MSIREISVSADESLARIIPIEAAAKTIATSALNAMSYAAGEADEAGQPTITVGTLIVALTNEFACLMSSIDAAAAAEVFEMMAEGIRRGPVPPDAAARQRMFKAQRALSVAEVTLMAKLNSRGSA